tara:strand:- start:2609 stop:3400 length:792 start_codon:yes stop_codon:yes gene_type:complete
MHQIRFLTFLTIAALLTPILGLAQEDATPPPSSAESVTSSQEEVTTGGAFLLKLKQGGGTMIMLLLCSIVSVACTAERVARQRKERIAPDGVSERVAKLWDEQKFAEIEALGAEQPSTLTRMLAAVARFRESGVERVSTITGDIASRDLKRHVQAAFPLAVVATLAPLLGLFGTVLGMIGAFDKIALMGELANPSAFGGDIGKALITTGAGLAVAIASLALYHFFKSRVGIYSVELEEQVSELISDWFDKPANSKAKGDRDAN